MPPIVGVANSPPSISPIIPKVLVNTRNILGNAFRLCMERIITMYVTGIRMNSKPIMSGVYALNELPVWIPDGIWLKKIPRITPNIPLYMWEWRMLVLVMLGFIITRMVFQPIPSEFRRYNSTTRPAIAVNRNRIRLSLK